MLVPGLSASNAHDAPPVATAHQQHLTFALHWLVIAVAPECCVFRPRALGEARDAPDDTPTISITMRSAGSSMGSRGPWQGSPNAREGDGWRRVIRVTRASREPTPTSGMEWRECIHRPAGQWHSRWRCSSHTTKSSPVHRDLGVPDPRRQVFGNRLLLGRDHDDRVPPVALAPTARRARAARRRSVRPNRGTSHSTRPGPASRDDAA